jgi:hypothetical protein
VTEPNPHPRMTVSQILAAHAAAQIAAARDADLAGHAGAPPPAKLDSAQGDSFTVSWAAVTMCIGFKKPVAN